MSYFENTVWNTITMVPIPLFELCSPNTLDSRRLLSMRVKGVKKITSLWRFMYCKEIVNV